MTAVVPRGDFLRAFILLGLLLCAPPAFADQYDQARAWLERMATAMHDLSYQGTFVYQQEDRMETMRLEGESFWISSIQFCVSTKVPK